MILKEDGNEVFFSLLEVGPPAFVETETETGASAEVLTSRSPFLNDTPRALSGTDGTCFFTGLTLVCSPPCPCLAFFADFGLEEDMREDPRLGLGARRSTVDATKRVKRAARKAMRRCLQQRRTLSHRNNLSSRFFVTVATQASWRHAVEQKNASVNALVHVVPEDEAGPVSDGPLNGMTVAVKDNICTKNMPTTCSSAMLRGKVCSPCSSPRYITHEYARQTFNHLSTRLSYTCCPPQVQRSSERQTAMNLAWGTLLDALHI